MNYRIDNKNILSEKLLRTVALTLTKTEHMISVTRNTVNFEQFCHQPNADSDVINVLNAVYQFQ